MRVGDRPDPWAEVNAGFLPSSLTHPNAYRFDWDGRDSSRSPACEKKKIPRVGAWRFFQQTSVNGQVKIFDTTAPTLPSKIWLGIPPDRPVRKQALGLRHRFCSLLRALPQGQSSSQGKFCPGAARWHTSCLGRRLMNVDNGRI
jgi:hypothetical protein